MTSDPVPLKPEAEASASADREERLRFLRGGPGRDRKALRWLLPLVALGVGGLIYALLVATREQPRTREPVVPSPLVRVMTAKPEDLRMTVVARGSVAPRTESDLVAEVRGRVLSISPQLVVGGFFAEGDELLRLDDREHRIAVQRARANVKLKQSEHRLAIAEAQRRRQLQRRGAASAADLEQFESRELVASASLSEAQAVLDQAELDLERTLVRAPFDGRVRERNVDVGQFVTPGIKLGRVFAVDYAEVRLPIQTDDLAHLDTTRDPGGMSDGFERADVVLTGRLGGRELSWPARLVRAEAAIDEQTRMLHVVARIDDPYAIAGTVRPESTRAEPTGGSESEAESQARAAAIEDAAVGLESGGPGAPRIPLPRRVPLPAGLFVRAEIQGRLVEGVFVLPLMALRDGDRIFVYEEVAEADAGSEQDVEDAAATSSERGRLRIREVSVLRRDRERVVVADGLEAGDRVVISPLRIYSEGMRLRAVEAELR